MDTMTAASLLDHSTITCYVGNGEAGNYLAPDVMEDKNISHVVDLPPKRWSGRLLPDASRGIFRTNNELMSHVGRRSMVIVADREQQGGYR